MNTMDLKKKTARLEEIVAACGTLLVAFSGGVDSTLLLAMARRVLGGDRVLAVTWASPFHAGGEVASAVQLAAELDVLHKLIETDTIFPPELSKNPRNRCYICKKQLSKMLLEIAREREIATIAHGANLDDLKDFRPGFQAAREAGMRAPLIDAGFTKADIRELSKQMGLPTWNKPALACLATRIPYDTPITIEALRRVEAAEAEILSRGFSNCRVRCHGTMARIELPPEELGRMLDAPCRERIIRRLREIGFLHVALDLEGYRQGKMNRE